MTTPIDALATPSLRAFVRVAELGSVTKAARELHLSQPAVTIAVRKLEEELGTSLFIRTSRGVTLTKTGEALLARARDVLRTLRDARAEIDALEHEPRGTFSLGCHESLGAYFLPGFMTAFLAAHPGIELALVNANSREVERMVIERAIDVGLVVNPGSHPDAVVSPLFTDRVELLATPQLRRTKRDPRALLASVPLLYVPALRQVQYILGALDQAGATTGRHLPCSSLELVKSLALDGAGVAILPSRVATYRTSKGALAAIAPNLPAYDDTISLVRRVDTHVTSAARLLLDALAARGRELARGQAS